MKIALMSVADIRNYGDVFFDFIARQEMQKYFPDAEFRFFTPMGGVIENEEFYCYTKKALSQFNPDAILCIGGEVIHKYNDVVWQDMYHGKVAKPSDVVFDWVRMPNVYKAWFSVGALDLAMPMEQISDEELGGLNYIGVRGILSKKILEHKDMLFRNSKIDMVPDIGWIFPRYCKNPKRILKQISKKYCFKLKPNSYFVFNVNWTSIPKDKIFFVLDEIFKFQRLTGLKVVILSVISSYKKLDVDISLYMNENENILVLDDVPLLDTCALLMEARFFIGSSLHCAITTLAFGKPAGLIHNTMLTKFQDLFNHMMMPELLSNEWDSFPNLLLYLYNFKKHKLLKKYVGFMTATFDEKMRFLCADIKKFWGL